MFLDPGSLHPSLPGDQLIWEEGLIAAIEVSEVFTFIYVDHSVFRTHGGSQVPCGKIP